MSFRDLLIKHRTKPLALRPTTDCGAAHRRVRAGSRQRRRWAQRFISVMLRRGGRRLRRVQSVVFAMRWRSRRFDGALTRVMLQAGEIDDAEPQNAFTCRPNAIARRLCRMQTQRRVGIGAAPDGAWCSARRLVGV
jgi:hypothetical protein